MNAYLAALTWKKKKKRGCLLITWHGNKNVVCLWWSLINSNITWKTEIGLLIRFTTYLYAVSVIANTCGGTSWRFFPLYSSTIFSVYIGRRWYGFTTTQKRPEYVWKNIDANYLSLVCIILKLCVIWPCSINWFEWQEHLYRELGYSFKVKGKSKGVHSNIKIWRNGHLAVAKVFL